MTAMLMVQDETVSTPPGLREGGPRRRRAFTTAEKLQHLTAYEVSCAAGGGGPICGSRGCTPRRPPSGGSSATQGCWPAAGQARRSAGRRPSRWRSRG